MTLADTNPPAESDAAAKADVEQFLEGLRHAWKEGEVRPTSRRKPPVPRGRRRPDPLAKVTNDLRAWFDEDRARTGRDLLSKLQIAYPDAYPDGLLRTVQRRLKGWRAAMARELVFGINQGAPDLKAPNALRDLEASRVRGLQDPALDLSSSREILREHSPEATA